MLSYTKFHSTHSQTNTSISTYGHHHPVAQNRYDPGHTTRVNPNPLCTHFYKNALVNIPPSAFFCKRKVDICNKHVSQKVRHTHARQSTTAGLSLGPLGLCSRSIMAMGHYLLGRPWEVSLGEVEK